jgi:nucleoside-diphosphate-sugar epimerase
MALAIATAAILGATGPTGRALARELLGRGVAVRVVARSEGRLAQAFDDPRIERHAADLRDAAQARRALSGCDVAFDCIGLPAEQMADHPVTARAIAEAGGKEGTRLVQVSSYWAYLPAQSLPMTEDHPRSGGSAPVRLRRDAEDILLAAGAAVANLPDFYGPEVHTGTLQQALAEAAAGRTVNWLGGAEVAHEYVYVPDAMRAVTDLAAHADAYGKRWIVPGGGAITGARVAEIAGAHLGRRVRLRCAGPLVLRLVALFDRRLRPVLPMVPYYVAPISFDGARLKNLIGAVPATPYEQAIPRTLDWLTRAAVSD